MFTYDFINQELPIEFEFTDKALDHLSTRDDIYDIKILLALMLQVAMKMGNGNSYPDFFQLAVYVDDRGRIILSAHESMAEFRLFHRGMLRVFQECDNDIMKVMRKVCNTCPYLERKGNDTVERSIQARTKNIGTFIKLSIDSDSRKYYVFLNTLDRISFLVSGKDESKANYYIIMLNRFCFMGNICHGCGISCDEARKCGACQWTRYCSEICQKFHWPTHKAGCSKVKKAAAKALTAPFEAWDSAKEFRDNKAAEDDRMRQQIAEVGITPIPFFDLYAALTAMQTKAKADAMRQVFYVLANMKSNFYLETTKKIFHKVATEEHEWKLESIVQICASLTGAQTERAVQNAEWVLQQIDRASTPQALDAFMQALQQMVARSL